MNIMFPPENADKLPLDEIEKKFFPQVEKFTKLGSAYASEHGQRTATIGLVLSSNPIALLAWYVQPLSSSTCTRAPLPPRLL